jgi:SAM-dependent methyltransferase
LNEEAAVWGAVAMEHAAVTPPTWAAHRQLRHNWIQHARDIDALLARVRPGMRVLELGCASGWLTLAMAERGAIAHGVDIAASAVEIARTHYQSVAHDVQGVATYEVADLNELELVDRYDLVVAKGILHHLVKADALVARVHEALNPGGLLWISDNHGTEAIRTAVVAGALMFVLPTQLSYREKLLGLVRFGRQAPDRIRASMETEGFSPFEGAGRDVGWPRAVEERFIIESRQPQSAFTLYLAPHIRLPDVLTAPLLHAIHGVDRALVRLGALSSTGVTLWCRKPPVP